MKDLFLKSHDISRSSKLARLGLNGLAAELLVGVVLGPTILGRISPDFQQWLFPESGTRADLLYGASQISLWLFLFAASVDLDLATIRRRGKTIAWTATFGTLIPFGVGSAAAFFLPAFWNLPQDHGAVLPALVIGTLLAISALPVIMRILVDLELDRTPLGSVIVGAATIDDLISWIILGTIISSVVPQFDWLGGHGLLLVFLAGAVVSTTSWRTRAFVTRLRRFVMTAVAPLYFISIGLKLDLFKEWDTALVFGVLGVSSLTKISGVTLGARISGTDTREALAIALGMNARGAMGIVLANIALQYGLLDQRLFVAFTTMAVLTSMASGPLMLQALTRRERSERKPVRAQPSTNVEVRYRGRS